MSAPPWSLHPRLDADTTSLGDLPLSRVVLMNDANYPWLLLVPRRGGASEIIDLGDADRTQLMDEIALVSRALREATACDKLNVAAIGNVVSQLHVHVVARRRDDPAWPRPVWGAAPPLIYEPDARDRLSAVLRRTIPLA
jgi:diadenosine tetraphosphate (Ap4A) HIT family hydrolase